MNVKKCLKKYFLALGRQLGTSNKCIKLFSTELQKGVIISIIRTMENTYPIAKRIKPEKEIVDFETSRKANEDAQKRSDNTY